MFKPILETINAVVIVCLVYSFMDNKTLKKAMSKRKILINVQFLPQKN